METVAKEKIEREAREVKKELEEERRKHNLQYVSLLESSLSYILCLFQGSFVFCFFDLHSLDRTPLVTGLNWIVCKIFSRQNRQREKDWKWRREKLKRKWRKTSCTGRSIFNWPLLFVTTNWSCPQSPVKLKNYSVFGYFWSPAENKYWIQIICIAVITWRMVIPLPLLHLEKERILILHPSHQPSRRTLIHLVKHPQIEWNIWRTKLLSQYISHYQYSAPWNCFFFLMQPSFSQLKMWTANFPRQLITN